MKNQGKRVSQPAPRRKKKPIAAIVIAALVVVSIAVCAYVYAAPALSYDTIYPNVYVAGVNVGGMTKVDAKQAVETAVQNTYGTETMLVELPDRTLEFPPELTRVTVNTDAAIDEAWRYGREGNVFSQAKALRKAEESEYRIDLKTELELDEEAIRARIEKTAESLDGRPKQTQLDLDLENNRLTIKVGVSGKVLDAEALYALVHEQLLASNFSPIVFDYTVASVDPVNLQEIYDQIGKSAKDAYFDEESGELVAETNGYGFDVAAVEQRMALAAEGELIEVELQTIVPEVTLAELQEIYFRDELSSYDSWHVYNPNRTNNLELAANAVNGTVIMPGDIFSFNKTVGERTSEKGYLEASVYVNGATVGELGGGVCQVASTIYYCALYANQEIVEREEHMYVVDYVPRGLDATIYWGLHDFRFRNTTEYPMRIESSVSGGYVHVKLIGTKTDETYVKMTNEQLSTTEWETVDEDERVYTKAPELGEDIYLCEDDGLYYKYLSTIETPYTGYTYYTYRNVYNADGSLISTTREDKTTYIKRDMTIEVELMDPQPGEEPDEPIFPFPGIGGWGDPTTEPNDPFDPIPDPDEDVTYPGSGTFDPIPDPDDYWP